MELFNYMTLWGHLICVHMTHRESCWGIITDVFLSTVQSINFPVHLTQASYDKFYKVNEKLSDSRFICFVKQQKQSQNLQVILPNRKLVECSEEPEFHHMALNDQLRTQCLTD